MRRFIVACVAFLAVLITANTSNAASCKMTIAQAEAASAARYPHDTFIAFQKTQGARLIWFFENYVVPTVPGRGRLVIRANTVYIGEGPARHDIVLFGDKGCMTFALRVRKSDIHKIVRDAIGDAI